MSISVLEIYHYSNITKCWTLPFLFNFDHPYQSNEIVVMKGAFVFVLPYKPVEVDLPFFLDGVAKIWLRKRLHWLWLIQRNSKD